MSKIRKYLPVLRIGIFSKYLVPFLVTLLVFIFIKSFLFDIVIVGSPAMEKTLHSGEWVFVKKIFNPVRNNLVRIYLPLSKNDTDVVASYVFKRIIAVAGDTVEIRNSNVLVNGELIEENNRFLHNYIAKIKLKADSAVFKKNAVTDKYLIDDSCVYMLPLTEKVYNEFLSKKIFHSLISSAEDSAVFDENVFPYESQFKWNGNYFGPLYVPKKGDSLALDSSSIKLYKRIIRDLENNILEIMKDAIFINGRETSVYVVKQNYYFVIGDNFDNSIDSRNWGFIPEKKIKSRVMFRK